MAPLIGFVEENIPVVDKFYIDIEVFQKNPLFALTQLQTSYYQPGEDFCDVPDEIYQTCISCIAAEWLKYVKKHKKNRKKEAQHTSQAPLQEPSAKQRASLPAWAIVTEEEKEQARRSIATSSPSSAGSTFN